MSRNSERLSDIDAEKAVLGAALLDRSCIPEVLAEVSSADFYHPAHAAIFEAMTELDRSSSPIDAVSVAGVLRNTGRIDALSAVGGADYIPSLLLEVVTTTNVAYHAKSIAKKSDRRRWIAGASTVVTTGHSDGDDEAFVASAEKTFLDLTSRQRGESGPISAKPVMHEVVKILEKRYENRHLKGVTGIATGLQQLDKLTMGWQPSDLVVIAGRPSMGKTAAAMLAACEAAKAGVATLVFSLEMSKESLMERATAMESMVDGYKIRSGELDHRDFVSITKAAGVIAGLPLWIEDRSALTIGDIRSRARRWRANPAKKHDKAIVVVDYIGLVHPDAVGKGSTRNREREVAEISAGLKSLAKDLGCPVVALSQLNRTCETRHDKRPMLSDLRESGSIEQDADVIAFLYRDEYYHDEPPKGQCGHCGPGVAEIIIAKQRNGATGTAHVGWRAEQTKFVNLANRDF